MVPTTQGSPQHGNLTTFSVYPGNPSQPHLQHLNSSVPLILYNRNFLFPRNCFRRVSHMGLYRHAFLGLHTFVSCSYTSNCSDRFPQQSFQTTHVHSPFLHPASRFSVCLHRNVILYYVCSCLNVYWLSHSLGCKFRGRDFG